MFRVEPAAGLDIWLDDSAVSLNADGMIVLSFNLNVGVHKLTLRVDSAARKGLPIKVEVSKPEGSSAEFTVVGGR
jgi:hypothetical protein